jgi:hypothetical protein
MATERQLPAVRFERRARLTEEREAPRVLEGCDAEA